MDRVLEFILLLNLVLFLLGCYIYGSYLTSNYWSGSKQEKRGRILEYVGLFGMVITYAIVKIFVCVVDGHCGC